VPQVRQVHPVATELAGQRRRRHAPGDAAEDEDDLSRPPLHPLQGGPGPGVEGAAAMAALVVAHRGAVAAVDAEAIGGTAAGAGRPSGVEGREELGVAGVLVHQVGEREVHGGSSPGEEGDHRIGPEAGMIVE
jgi:hypothetical protein